MAGKVAKGEEIGKIKDWRQYYVEKLSPLGNFKFVSPENPDTDETKPFEVFGYACHLIKESDMVLVDASQKLGVGTSQEMLVAKHFNKRVATILPPNTPHRRTNLQMYEREVKDWIHPFIYSTSDHIFSNSEEVKEFFSNISEHLKIAPKNISVIDSAIESYLKLTK